MSFTLKHRETDGFGSFKASGAGLHYEYDSDQALLDIIQKKGNRLILSIELEEEHPGEAFLFAKCLEKATQIKALTYSNFKTINLCKIMDSDKLPAIMANTTVLSRYAFDLKLSHFNRFACNFGKKFPQEEVYINRTLDEKENIEIFRGLFKTRHGHAVSAYKRTLSELLSTLSEKITIDLMTLEFGNRFRDSAESLVNVSYNLSTVARIVDEGFIPHNTLNKNSEFIQQIKV